MDNTWFLWKNLLKLIIDVQCVFKQQFGINGRVLAPLWNKILMWVRKWLNTGSVLYMLSTISC